MMLDRFQFPERGVRAAGVVMETVRLKAPRVWGVIA